MKMVQFSEQFQMAYDKAKSFLSNITTSSRLGVAPDRATLSFLRASVMTGTYTVYRGLSLDELPEGLVMGQPVPEGFSHPKDAQICIHTTDDEDVAFGYASGGGKDGFVYSLRVDSSQIIFDSARVLKAFPDIDPELAEYFHGAKEVLLKKDAFFQTKVVNILKRK